MAENALGKRANVWRGAEPVDLSAEPLDGVVLSELGVEFDAMQDLASVILHLPAPYRGRVLDWFRAWSEANFGVLALMERIRKEVGDGDG